MIKKILSKHCSMSCIIFVDKIDRWIEVDQIVLFVKYWTHYVTQQQAVACGDEKCLGIMPLLFLASLSKWIVLIQKMVHYVVLNQHLAITRACLTGDVFSRTFIKTHIAKIVVEASTWNGALVGQASATSMGLGIGILQPSTPHRGEGRLNSVMGL